MFKTRACQKQRSFIGENEKEPGKVTKFVTANRTNCGARTQTANLTKPRLDNVANTFTVLVGELWISGVFSN